MPPVPARRVVKSPGPRHRRAVTGRARVAQSRWSVNLATLEFYLVTGIRDIRISGCCGFRRVGTPALLVAKLPSWFKFAFRIFNFQVGRTRTASDSAWQTDPEIAKLPVSVGRLAAP